MPLYELKSDQISSLSPTTFTALGIRERNDLQRLLRENIEVICPETLVLTDEFGDWEDSKRRIDLLGLDRQANLVVVELKRTEDGGHMELQALRYAAMVSTMTFDQAVEAHEAFLLRLGSERDAREEILDYLGWEEPNDDDFGRSVRLTLASADFSKEITTTVLWLNKLGLQIDCVRLVPYRYLSSTFLDVQKLIPLPEATEYQVRLKYKEQQQQISRQSASQKDYTRFAITTKEGTTEPLAKRWAILRIVQALARDGVPISEIEEVIRLHHGWGSRSIRSVPGQLDAEAFVSAAELGNRAKRYFCRDSELLHDTERTYALTNQWGDGTAEAVEALIAAFPGHGITTEAVARG